MKLTKPFRAVPPGEIYPVEYPAGADCPPEYEESARAQGCLPADKPAPSPATPKKKA